jgi:hypothetical protein
MVCDGGMLASTIVSLMMNGVCCMWQQQEEKERREVIRRDIRTEYWHQRLIDHELLMQHKERRAVTLNEDSSCFSSVRRSSDSSLVQAERRKKLLLDKMNASSNSRKQDEATASGEIPALRDVAIPVAPQTSPRMEEKLPLAMNHHRANSFLLATSAHDVPQGKHLTTIEGIGRRTSLADNDSEDDEDVGSVSSSFTEICLY